MSRWVVLAVDDGFRWTDLIPWGSAVLAIGGVLLGQWMGRTSSLQTWMRDEQLKAYVAYLQDAARIWETLTEMYRAPVSRKVSEELNTRLQASRHQAAHTFTVCELISPPDVKAAGDEYDDALESVADMVCDLGRRRSSREEYGEKLLATPEAKTYVAAEEAWIAEVRQQFGLDALPRSS